MKQFNKEEAVFFAENRIWESLSLEQRAKFQMSQKLICMPFSVFHEAIEKTLGRPVYTHEFGLNWDGLRKELFDKGPAPSLSEIIEMIPEDKRMIIRSDDLETDSTRKR